jgi:hypothetical protein
MRNGIDSILSAIHEHSDCLQGNAEGIAKVIDELAAMAGRTAMAWSCDVEPFEPISPLDEAACVACGDAWSSVQSGLLRLSHSLRHTAEFYV